MFSVLSWGAQSWTVHPPLHQNTVKADQATIACQICFSSVEWGRLLLAWTWHLQQAGVQSKHFYLHSCKAALKQFTVAPEQLQRCCVKYRVLCMPGGRRVQTKHPYISVLIIHTIFDIYTPEPYVVSIPGLGATASWTGLVLKMLMVHPSLCAGKPSAPMPSSTSPLLAKAVAMPAKNSFPWWFLHTLKDLTGVSFVSASTITMRSQNGMLYDRHTEAASRTCCKACQRLFLACRNDCKMMIHILEKLHHSS